MEERKDETSQDTQASSALRPFRDPGKERQGGRLMSREPTDSGHGHSGWAERAEGPEG